MVTLTYPAEFPDAREFVIYKKHLRRLFQEVNRVWGCSGVWVEEFQRRGAVHFHALLFGLSSLELREFQLWLSSTWYRVCGTEDPKHLQAGTQCEPAKSAHGARGYLCQYMSKEHQSGQGIAAGRHWGKFNAKQLPSVEPVTEDVNPLQAKLAARVCRAFISRKCRDSGWAKLSSRMRKLYPSLGELSALELETCLKLNKRGITVYTRASKTWLEGELCESSMSVSTAFVAMAVEEHGGPPPRWRMRQNRSMNVFCDASSFLQALKRHPAWNDKPPEPKMSAEDEALWKEAKTYAVVQMMREERRSAREFARFVDLIDPVIARFSEKIP